MKKRYIAVAVFSCLIWIGFAARHEAVKDNKLTGFKNRFTQVIRILNTQITGSGDPGNTMEDLLSSVETFNAWMDGKENEIRKLQKSKTHFLKQNRQLADENKNLSDMLLIRNRRIDELSDHNSQLTFGSVSNKAKIKDLSDSLNMEKQRGIQLSVENEKLITALSEKEEINNDLSNVLAVLDQEIQKLSDINDREYLPEGYHPPYDDLPIKNRLDDILSKLEEKYAFEREMADQLVSEHKQGRAWIWVGQFKNDAWQKRTLSFEDDLVPADLIANKYRISNGGLVARRTPPILNQGLGEEVERLPNNKLLFIEAVKISKDHVWARVLFYQL